MFIHCDQLNNQLILKERPKRIISLVPSQSEFLWHIGLHEELVGITKFCIHPDEMFRTVERVGGTKNLDLDKIRALRPDLIIGNKEENERSQIEALQQEFPVWMSDIFNFEDAFDMMEKLGAIFEKQKEAKAIVSKIKKHLPSVKNIFSGQSLAYFIWNKPYMLAAQDTFIDHVITYLGFKNAAAGLLRYPELSDEALQKINPAVCFLSSEPFPFKEKHVQALQQTLPHAKILIVDGEVFSWYGSRLQHLTSYVKELAKQING